MLFRTTSLCILLLPISVFAQSVTRPHILTQDDLLRALMTAGENSSQLLASNEKLLTGPLCDQLVAKAGEHLDRSDYGKALPLYEAAKGCATRLGDKTRLTEILYRIGRIYYEQGQLTKAADTYLLGVKAATTPESQKELVYILKNLSVTYRDMGNYERATEYIDQSFALAKTLNDQKGIALYHLVMGTILLLKGDYDESLTALGKSLPLFTILKDNKYIAITLMNLASNYVYRGNYSEAISQYNKAIELVGEQQRTQMAIFAHLGILYGYQGDYDNMLMYLQKSLKIAEQYGDSWSVANNLLGIGGAYEHQQNYDRALECFQKSLPIAEKVPAQEVIILAQNQIGKIYQRTGRLKLALEFYQKSLGQAQQLGNKHRAAFILGDIANLCQSRGDYTRALHYANQAAAIAGQINEPEPLYLALTAAGKAYHALKDDDAATRAFTRAIDAVEVRREFVMGGERSQEHFFESKVTPYYEMTHILVGQGKVEQALGYVERAKGRALLDVLHSGRTNVSRAMTAPERDEERRLNGELVDLNKKILTASRSSAPDEKELAGLKEQLQTARSAYETFHINLYGAHPELKIKRAELAPFTLKEADELLPDSKTALLDYMVAEDHAYLFVLTKGAEPGSADQGMARGVELRVYPIAIGSDSLRAKVELFRQRVAEGSQQYRGLARELYDLLLKPAEEQLQGRTMLAIVPDGVLWSLPFQTLESRENRYVVEDHALFYAPSLNVLRTMEQRRTRGGAGSSTQVPAITTTKDPRSKGEPAGLELLAMGNPKLGEDEVIRTRAALRGGTLEPLPAAENEVQTIAQLHGRPPSTKVYIQAKATEQVFKTLAPRARIIHVATHGILDDHNPMYSYLALANSGGKDDGLLEAWEVMDLDLHAELAVLSACETARGRAESGEGVIGMTWALFVAGCPTTVVSLWKVESESTRQLMIAFHRNLNADRARQSPLHTAEALRQAQLRLLKEEAFRHPAYWAGFVVMGDGR